MKQNEIRDIKIIVGLLVLGTAAVAVRQAWGSYKWVGEFFEYFVAGILWLVLILGVPGVAIVAGVFAARQTEQVWVGWIAGIALCVVLWLFLPIFIEEIPGVGWKFKEQMSSDSY